MASQQELAAGIEGRLERLSPEKRALLQQRLTTRKMYREPQATPGPSDRVPVSFAQQRLWFIDQLEPGSGHYNIPSILRLSGLLDRKCLSRAIREIVTRHAALRTRFIAKDGEPFQEVLAERDVPLSFEDLSALRVSERERRVEKVGLEECTTGFDLAHDPLLRIRLLKLSEEEHVLFVTMHHIVSDGWSMQVFYRELSQLYGAYLEGMPSPLEPLSLHYTGYTEWQRSYLTGEVLEQQLDYWKTQLSGLSPLELPTDEPRIGTLHAPGGSYVVAVPESIDAGLRRIARREGVSLFMVLLAAFKVLLLRYTGQEDIAVGTPIAGRTRSELERLIGFFVNTLVVRTDLSGEPTFREVLRRVRKVTLDAYTHQDLPFDKLVQELNPERDLGRNPLAPVFFNMGFPDPAVPELPGLKVESQSLPPLGSKTEISVHAGSSQGVLRLAFQYDSRLFFPESIARMAGHYVQLLEGIVANPGGSITRLPMLTTPERLGFLSVLSATARPYPSDRSVHELFEGQVGRAPEAIAVRHGEVTVTYDELNKRANVLAARLFEAGVRAGAPIGIFAERSVQHIVGMLGILKAGAVYVPLDPGYPKDRLQTIVQDAEIALILSTRDDFEAPVRIIPIASDEQLNGVPPQPKTDAGMPAYIMYTSGSTGKPKGVVIPHRAITRLVVGTDYVQFGRDDVVAHLSNTAFDPATFEIWGALLNGAQVVILDQDVVLSPVRLAEAIRENGITILCLTAALFNLVAQEVPDAFASLRYVFFGGEAADAASIRHVLRAGRPEHLINAYGPTEGTTNSTCYPIEDVSENQTTVPIGKPISNTSVYILDRWMNLLPVGIPGELYIGGDGLALGYHNRPELTAERFVPHPFSTRPGDRLYRTGDLVRWLPDGNIDFLGRVDDQVKIRGYRIELEEIAVHLRRHPAVAQAIVAVRDTAQGKHLVAFVVFKPGAVVEGSELQQFLHRTLSEYMVPAEYVPVAAFPLTPNGKVDRKALLSRPAASEMTARACVAPRSALESQLAGIWKEVLGVSHVSVHDNFFDLGGHSLLVVRLVSRLGKVLGREVPVASIFEAPTVAQLANLLEKGSDPVSGRYLVPIQTEGSGIPLFGCHGVGSGVMHFLPLARGIGAHTPFYGLQGEGLDGGSISDGSVDAWASRFADEILQLRPEGPYYLIGYCLGGLVAYEVARQLDARGKTPAFVGLIDSVNTNWARSIRAERYRRRLQTLTRQDVVSQVRWARGFLAAQVESIRGMVRRHLAEAYLKLGRRVPEELRKDYLVTANQTVIQAHTLRPYSGKVTVFRTSELSKRLINAPEDLGWSELAGTVDVVEVQGEHLGIMSEPGVRVLAHSVREYLNSLERKAMTVSMSDTISPFTGWVPPPEVPVLEADEVHIWGAVIPQDPVVMARYVQLLSDDERARAGRFKFELHRNSFVVSRALLRLLLARYAGRHAADIRLTYTRYGKPFLADKPDPGLQFNLSHSGEVVLIAVSNTRVGVDIERIRDDEALELCGDLYLTDHERKDLENVPDGARPNFLTGYWTKKEALTKAVGRGLRYPMHWIDVSNEPEQTITLEPAGEGEPSTWEVYDLGLTGGYRAAVAIGASVRRICRWQLAELDVL